MSSDTKKGGFAPANSPFTDGHETVTPHDSEITSTLSPFYSPQNRVVSDSEDRLHNTTARAPTQRHDLITCHDARADHAIALLDAGDINAALAALGLEVRP